MLDIFNFGLINFYDGQERQTVL